MSEAAEQQPLLSHPDTARSPSISRTPDGPGRTIRPALRRFLTSKIGHYAVLLLVSLDVGCIFADFLLSLYIYTQMTYYDHGSISTLAGASDNVRRVEKAQEALGIVSLTFSSLFMVELIASVWAFGWSFFKSKFHVFDATVIVASFIVDVCLKGVLEEVGSIVVVLRLWRVVKIIDELSAGAAERMDAIQEYVEKLEAENKALRMQSETGNPT